MEYSLRMRTCHEWVSTSAPTSLDGECVTMTHSWRCWLIRDTFSFVTNIPLWPLRQRALMENASRIDASQWRIRHRWMNENGEIVTKEWFTMEISSQLTESYLYWHVGDDDRGRGSDGTLRVNQHAARHCNTLATHCNTLQDTAIYLLITDMSAMAAGKAPGWARCNTVQHTCNTPQHTATHCNTLQHIYTDKSAAMAAGKAPRSAHCNTLQHTCNTLQHTYTDKSAAMAAGETPRSAECNTVQHAGYTLQHTATHGNTLQHTCTDKSAAMAAGEAPRPDTSGCIITSATTLICCVVNESCHTYEWVMSHIWMSHVTHTNESCHIRMSHATHTNKSWNTYEWVMSRWYVVNESCQL